mmetsp:Transcript_63686/g.177113  ORF Transcript_63686/g.177113 Transcript_63686/m.177113 type:complete len:1974 (+) Transcript_63686:72-5993(+)
MAAFGNMGAGRWQAPAAGGGAKRQAPTATAAPQKAPKVATNSMVVFSASGKDEIGIRTLVGEYAEQGTNHGRKVYKKSGLASAGQEKVDVFLYFWDNRDGPAFSGWWFGNEVGGAQVWSRSQQTTQQPPKSGWSIPWDGKVNPDLVVMGSKEKAMMEQNEAKMKQATRVKEESSKADQNTAQRWEERVQEATEKVATAEVDIEQSIEDAQVAMEGGEESEIASAATQLTQQATSLAETQRSIAAEAVAAQKAPPALKAEMAAMSQRMRKLQADVKEAQAKLKNVSLMQVKAADDAPAPVLDARERALEGQHSKQLEEMLPLAMEKVDVAEDEVEKAAIAAAPLNIDTADDLRSVMLGAIKETEQRVRTAQAAIGDARRFIAGKIAQVQRFVPTTKKAALEEFQSLQTRLNEAQEKLTPFKTIRGDYEQRVQAKKLYEELSSKLAGAEIEVEKAAMMTAPLGGDSVEAIKETEAALSTAQSALSATTRLIDSRLKAAEKGGAGSTEALEEVKMLQDRARQSQEKLDDVRKTVKETQIRVAADTLLKDVSEKVSNAEDELQRMAEAELPFLRGSQKGEELEALIQDADKIATSVHTAIAEAQTFVARKLVEVARFTEGPARAVREEIDMLQKRLEDGRDRLQQFRASTAERKRAFLLQDVEAKVAAAEGELSKMTEATAALGAVGSAGDTISDSLKEAVEQANLCERTAQASIVVARKHLIQKTAELKKLAMSGTGSGTELGKLQTRVNNMQSEITKLRTATKDAEERIRVKQMLAEVALRLQSAEAEVDKVASAAVPLAQADPSPELVERTDKATASAQTKLGATAKLVDVKLKSAQGFLKEELQGMRGRITQAEVKLGQVIRASKEQKERLEASELVAQAIEKVEAAEGAVKSTADAELPFLKGLEVLESGDAQKAIADSEKAATVAQRSVSDARTFAVQKIAEAKQFSSKASESCTKELAALQKRLDASAARLAEMKKDTAERKRRTQMQASGEKVLKVEAAMEKLSAEMMKFADEKLADISPGDARAACEDIATAEQAAQTAVAEARRFLAARSQEAKTLSEAQRASVTSELGKLQSRLTQCQVELAKLSKQCTEREQRFVAQKLLRNADDGLKKLQLDLELATKASARLLSKDHSEFLQALRKQALIEALQAYVSKDRVSAESLFAKVSGGAKSANAEQFIDFLGKLPELSGNDSVNFAEPEAKAVFSVVAGGKTLSLDGLNALLRERRVCAVATEATDALEGGKELGTVEVGEGVEVFEQKSVADGVRARCVLAKDGRTVWVTLESAGTSNFKRSSMVAGRVESLEACVSGVLARSTELIEAVDQKTVEVSSVKQGPLAEVKAKLVEARVKLGHESAKIEQLRKEVLAAKVSVTQKRKQELEEVLESKCKDMATKAVKEATDAVEAAEAKSAKVVEKSKASSADKVTTAQLDSLKSEADAAVKALTDAKAVVAQASGRLEAQRGVSRNFLLEPRVQLTKLTSRASAAERKCHAATDALRGALEQMSNAAAKQARAALRAAAQTDGKTSDELFAVVACGKDQITAAQFKTFVEKQPGHGMAKEQFALAFKAFVPHGAGMKRTSFAKAVQDFCTCAKPIAITDSFDIGASTTLRKLEPGEVFEVIEGPQEDTETHVARVRGRALRDGVTGWVSMKGNQGTPFLKKSEKPFMAVGDAVSLQTSLDVSSPLVRALQQDEVLELLEGPRVEAPAAELLLHAAASTDSAEGWITLRDSAGVTSASLSTDLFVCRSAIAMTDVFDIKSCKVVRKVSPGEALICIGGQKGKEDTDVEITRLQFRAAKDGSEGWVTLKGNQGTVFVEASKSHYVLDREAVLRASKDKSSAAVRKLAKGDVIGAKEKPLEERPASRFVVKARAVEDSASGWVTFEPTAGGAPLKPWKPKYVCRAPVAITRDDGKEVRQAEVGETFEAIDGPLLDKASGLRRIYCARAGGELLGWMALRGTDGEVLAEVA